MPGTAAEQAAKVLVDARRERLVLAELPEACRPRSPEEGYAAQRAFITAWGEPVAGWKAGATMTAVQQKFHLTEPFLGPVFKSTVFASPAALKAGDFEHRGATVAKPAVALEVEFSFRLGRDIAPRGAAYSEAEVLDAMDAMIPAIEIIAPRFQTIPFDSPGSALADCGVNGGIILGQPITDWRGIDYAGHETSLIIDGKSVAEGTGSLVLGHPFKSLIWLVNNIGKRGFSLRKGQVLTTGSMTGIVYADQGTHVVGDFGRLGKVEARFS